MKLSPEEHAEFTKWMDDKRLSYPAVGKLLGVSHPSVMKWRKGGGIWPAQKARLFALIRGGTELSRGDEPRLETAPITSTSSGQARMPSDNLMTEISRVRINKPQGEAKP